MDPFSIFIGSVGFLDVFFRVLTAIKDVYQAADKVEEEIAALSADIDALLSVHCSLKDFYDTKWKAVPASLASENDGIRVDGLWKEVAANLRDCRATVAKLEGLLKEIIGKDGKAKGGGKIDRIRKQLRKRSKDPDFLQLRQRLSNAQGSLQMLLTALNFEYTRSSHDLTDTSISQLPEKFDHVRQLGFTLQYQLSVLRPKLNNADDENLRNSINTAAAVVSSMHLNRHFHIPHAVSSIFTGRQKLLEELSNAYVSSSPEENQTQKRFVLQGLGGSGKTEFCCKFAQDNRQKFWGVFWIDATSDESAKHTFSTIAQIGGVDRNVRAAKSWLSSLELPWLLLIDNADDPQIPIEDYFPEGERGFVLITTRVPKHRRYGTIGKRFYRFENLETEAASELLLKAADVTCPWDSSAREAAAHIARALGCLPLALVHAGTAIANKLCELENYMNFYKRSWDEIRQARKDSRHFQDNEDDANMKVYSSYEVLYQKLEKTRNRTSQDAIELLKVFSFLRREDIRFDVLTAAAKNPWIETELREGEDRDSKTAKLDSKPKSWIQFLKDMTFMAREVVFTDRTPPVLPGILRDVQSPASFEDFDFRLRAALSLLTELSLISYHEEANSYSMHPLVHVWVRQRPQMGTGEQAIWCQAATTTLVQAIILSPSGTTSENAALQKDLVPHVVEVRSHQSQIRKKVVENQRLRKKPWPVPEPRFGTRQAIESVKFSLVYSQGGLWKEAEGLQLVVKNYLCGKLGLEHQLTMAVMMLLSLTYMQQSRQNKAASLRRQVFQACVNSLGPDHPKTLKAMDFLAESCALQGRFNEARQLHEKAVERMTEILGADHEDTLIAVENLGIVMSRYFLYEKALDLHLEAMTGMKRVFGPTDLRTLSATEHVALAYMEVGGELLDSAHTMQTQVLEDRRQKIGKEHPYTLLAIANLARVKTALNLTDEAEDLLRTAIPVAERNLGENHAGTLLGRVWLSQVLVRQQRYSEAEEILTKVVQRERYESSAREDGEHTDRIQALWFLLKCYQLQGKIEDAIRIGIELSEGVSTIGGEGLGKQHVFANMLMDKHEELLAAQKASVVELAEEITAETTADSSITVPQHSEVGGQPPRPFPYSV